MARIADAEFNQALAVIPELIHRVSGNPPKILAILKNPEKLQKKRLIGAPISNMDTVDDFHFNSDLYSKIMVMKIIIASMLDDIKTLYQKHHAMTELEKERLIALHQLKIKALDAKYFEDFVYELLSLEEREKLAHMLEHQQYSVMLAILIDYDNQLKALEFALSTEYSNKMDNVFNQFQLESSAKPLFANVSHAQKEKIKLDLKQRLMVIHQKHEKAAMLHPHPIHRAPSSQPTFLTSFSSPERAKRDEMVKAMMDYFEHSNIEELSKMNAHDRKLLAEEVVNNISPTLHKASQIEVNRAKCQDQIQEMSQMVNALAQEQTKRGHIANHSASPAFELPPQSSLLNQDEQELLNFMQENLQGSLKNVGAIEGGEKQTLSKHLH